MLCIHRHFSVRSNLPRSYSGRASDVENASGSSCNKIYEKLGLLKKLAGTAWGVDTNILRRVYTGAVRPIMPQPPGPPLQMSTRASSTESKMSHCWYHENNAHQGDGEERKPGAPGTPENISSSYPDREDPETTWSSAPPTSNSNQKKKKKAEKTGPQPFWPGTPGEQIETFWVHRITSKTSSVVDTGTRKIWEPPSS